jgi:hypothetical protein
MRSTLRDAAPAKETQAVRRQFASSHRQTLKAMKPILSKLIGRASDLVDVQPVIALFLGGALLAVFLTALFRARRQPESNPTPSLVWTLYRHFTRLLWAGLLVSVLLGSLSLLRVYLHQTLAGFQRTHGRVTQANYNAVQTIWGAEQEQGELHVANFWEEEVTERFEPEDVTKPAILRKKTVRHDVTTNPFVSARHDVTLKQNPRKKGSALYGGYETVCHFTWRLKNPADRDLKSILKFPLPASGSMYDDLSATLNGQDVLPQMQLKDAALILPRDLKPGETFDMAISFKSRGMSFWYLQVKESREIRDFTLTLNLPDLPKARLNYPEGCMTPTDIQPTPGNQGCVLTYRLDHAISNKGMGIALPTLPQPGEVTNAILAEVERGWLLVFAMLTLGLTLAGSRYAVLMSIGFGAASACIYGLVGDFSDLFSGAGGAELLILLPLFVALAWGLIRLVPLAGKVLALQFLLFGLIYPAAAGLDSDRQTLYFNVSALGFLCFGAWQVFQRLRSNLVEPEAQVPTATAAAAG